MVINNSWMVDYRHQVADHLAWLDKAGRGNLRIGACHKVLEPELIIDWQREACMDAILGGHNHHKGHINPHPVNDRLVAYVAPSREYFMFNLYQINSSQGTITPLGLINGDKASPGFGLATGLLAATQNPKGPPSQWKRNLTLSYAEDNTGASYHNTATLMNNFDFDIPGARVRFVMPKGAVYEVLQGAVSQAFDGDSVHVVDVHVDLGAKRTTTVQIVPVDSPMQPDVE
jgi:hypothetical protein